MFLKKVYYLSSYELSILSFGYNGVIEKRWGRIIVKKYLYLLFAQKSFFWKIYNYISKKIFEVKVINFSIRKKIQTKKNNYNTFQMILKIAQSSMVWAFITAIIMQFTNNAIKPYISDIKDYIDKEAFIDFATVDSSDYVTFLVIIATIGGVFIGLHYAGMTTLNGTLYSKLPTKVRNLLIHEKFGNVYIGFLSYLTYLAIVLIVFRLYDFERIYLVPFLMSIGVGVAIYAFIDLGKRVFYLFDPTKLSPIVFKSFFTALNNVKKGALYYGDKYFQKHNHTVARENIDSLVFLLTLAKQESHLSGDSLIKLQDDLLNQLIYYQTQKYYIPSNSLWYEEKYKHKDWYKIDDSITNIYYQSGSLPEADVVYNYFWVENRVHPILLDGIKINLENKRFDVVIMLLHSYSNYLIQMSRLEEFEFTIDQIDQLTKMILKVTKEKELDHNELEMLGVFEIIFNMPILILLTFYKNIDRYSYESTSKKLLLVDWNTKESLYNNSLDTYLLPELEELFLKLNYEKEIENKIISPHWYQLEIMMLFVSKRLIDNIYQLVSMFNRIYKSAYSELNDVKHAYFKASLLTKEWEFLKKMENQFLKIENILKDNNSNRKITTFNWKNIDISNIQTRLKSIEKEMLFDMSKSSFLVTDKSSDYPDFGGMFLHIVGEGLIDILCDNNIELFKKILPLYFLESILKSQMLTPGNDKQKWIIEQEFKIAVTPVMDLIDISGYALLLSLYFKNNKYWDVVKNTWDKYLKEHKNMKPEFFADLINLHESGFVIPHRSTNRMQWQQKIGGILNKLPKETKGNNDFLFTETIVVEHEEPLVRLFAERSSSHSYNLYSGIDIFITYYFKQLDKAKNLNFGRRSHRDIEKEVEEEKIKYEKYMENKNEN